jgi:hypothetical protein
MTNDVSVRRARQRAKKAAADGGSHQKALDGIARGQGHAHWGAMRSSQDVPSPRNVDILETLFTRGGIVAWIGDSADLSRIASYLTSVLVVQGEDAMRAVTAIMVARWLDSLGGVDPLEADRDSLLDTPQRIIQRTLDLHSGARHGQVPPIAGAAEMGEAVKKAMLGWVSGDRRLSHDVPVGDADVVTLRMADPDAVWSILDRLRRRAAAIVQDPGGEMRSGDSTLLPDDLLLRLVSLRMKGVTMSARQNHALARLVRALPAEKSYDGVSWSGMQSATAALGDAVHTAYRALEVHGMTAGRAEMVLRGLPTIADVDVGLSERHADALAQMREPLFTAWLTDAFAKIDAGGSPFSYNPVAAALESGTPDAVLGMCTDVAALSGSPEDRSAVAGMIADLAVVLVSTAPRRLEIGEDPEVAVSLPMIRSVVAAWRGRWEQLLLFASLNGASGERVSRLRDAFSKGFAQPALVALDVFSNRALARASS